MQQAPDTDVLVIEDQGQQRLAARTLVAALRQAGLSARLAHFGAGSHPEGVAALVRRQRPRLIVFSLLFAHLVAENLALATLLRVASARAHLALAGPLPAFAYADLLSACPALDSVLRGEAETAAVKLAANLKAGADWRGVPGLAYGWPALQVNALPPALRDLDALPFPARDEGIPGQRGFGFATVAGSRGCYHACSFCLPCWHHRVGTGHAYRLRSVPNLVTEIEALYRTGARLLLFDDEQFLPPGRARQERVVALGDELQRRGLEIAFTIKCRADDVDEALFRRLKAIGLIRAYVGIESGCQASLDVLGKGTTAAQNARALAALDRLGIIADFRCLLFHPWSTLETIQADITFLERVLPQVPTGLTFHEVACYAGTPLAERLQAEGRGRDGGWPLAYTIASPAAELLRRLSRVVFAARGPYRGQQARLDRAWFDLLLLRRFRCDDPLAGKAHALGGMVLQLNRGFLHIWREMLSFAVSGHLRDAQRVNEGAACWGRRVDALRMALDEDLSELSPERRDERPLGTGDARRSAQDKRWGHPTDLMVGFLDE